MTRIDGRPISSEMPQGGDYTRLETPRPGAPKPMDKEVKARIAGKMSKLSESVKENLSEASFLGAMLQEYKKGTKMAGEVFVDFARVKAPKEATPKEIGKFAGRIALSPFKIGIGALASTFIMAGMILGTPILALAKINPENTVTYGRRGTIGFR